MNSMYPKKSDTLRKALRPTRPPAPRGRRIQVRRSGIHGKGVFALVADRSRRARHRIHRQRHHLEAGAEAAAAQPGRPQPHVLLPHRRQARDRRQDGGNAAKWINHACGPNCEADEDDDAGRVFIKALRDIEPGEELNYDYGLILEGKHTKKVKKEFACHCGTPECRGTMLAKKK